MNINAEAANLLAWQHDCFLLLELRSGRRKVRLKTWIINCHSTDDWYAVDVEARSFLHHMSYLIGCGLYSSSRVRVKETG